VGSKWRREREKESNRLAKRERVCWAEVEMVWVENGRCEKGHQSIFKTQINRINRLSIKMDKTWVDLKFFCFTCAST